MYVRHTIGFDIRRVSAALDPEPAPEAGFAGNVAIEASTERVANSDAAIAAFLAQLPLRSGLGPEQILFVIDAIRPQLYEPAALARAEASYFGQMRRHFMQQASAARFEVLDMTAAFAASFEQDKQRFEFPGDNHWNALGHRVVADQVAASRVFARTFR